MASRFVLGVDQLVIGEDVEGASAGGDQLDRFDRVVLPHRSSQTAHQLFRQTGGIRGVVSLHAEHDPNAHGAEFTWAQRPVDLAAPHHLRQSNNLSIKTGPHQQLAAANGRLTRHSEGTEHAEFGRFKMNRVFALAIIAGTSAFSAANFVTGFEAPDYTGSAAGTALTGQQGWMLPAGVDHNVYTYAGNAPGFVAHPTGGGAQFAGGISQGGTLLARAEHAEDFTTSNVWTVSLDFAALYNGTPPSAQNLGSFSLQPSATARFFQSLYTWEDVAVPTTFDANYLFFDAAGVASLATLPGPEWNALVVNHWYRSSTTWDFSTNTILSVSITDLHTGTTATVNPTGWFLAGGASPTQPLPTAFRLFAGGAAGNTMGWDNLSVVPEPASFIALTAGALALLRKRRTG